jgi:hypothetical protein
MAVVHVHVLMKVNPEDPVIMIMGELIVVLGKVLPN